MNFVSTNNLPWLEKRLHAGNFHSYCRDVSLALGGRANLGPRFGGHPFDVQIRRMPSGATSCPHYHAHLTQSEFYLIQDGRGAVRTASGTTAVRPGDFVFFPPGAPHQFTADNVSGNELVMLIVADNPDFDACFYSDTGTWKGIVNGVTFDFAAAADELGKFFPEPTSPRVFNLDVLPWETFASPKGKYRSASKELSIALGAKRNTPAGLGGHVFDVEYARIEPRSAACPFHNHSAQTEFYLIAEGEAVFRTSDGMTTLRAGDATICLPHEAHQIRNDTDAPAHYFCIADNPPADSWHYPDSRKYGFRNPRKIFRLAEADYWDGEE